MKKLFSKILSVSLASVMALLAFAISFSNGGVKASAASNPTGVGRNVMVGYYHVFKNGAGNGLQLRDIDPCWDVVELSFGEPSGGAANIGFSPMTDGLYPDEESFKADVEFVQARGQKVCLSIGGQNGQVSLNSSSDAQTFTRTVCAIIDKYGLDGFDIDFEGHSLSLTGGDTSLKNPTSPTVVNLIAATKQICAKYGDGFILTMAPETLLCHNGCAFYGGSGDSRNGVYLPVIDALRGDLSWLQAQLYNTANGYSPYVSNPTTAFSSGSVWYDVVMMDTLLEGFYIGEIYTPANKGDPDKYFEGLRPDQMVLGVPSGSGSAGAGMLSPAQYVEVMEYMMNGGTVNGYTVKHPSVDFRGIMTWSINWDVFQGRTFSSTVSKFLDDVSGKFSLNVTSSKSGTVSAGDFATFTANASGKDLGTMSYTFSVIKNGSEVYKSSPSSNNKLTYSFTEPGTYKVNVSASSSNGNSAVASTDEFSVEITEAFISNISVTPAKGSVGSPITWNVTAGGSSAITYKYDIYNGNTLVKSAPNESSSYTFTPSSAGEYKVEVTVSDAYSSATKKGGLIWVSQDKALEINSVNTTVSGKTVDITVIAGGGSGGYTYYYYLTKDGKVYTPENNGSSSDTSSLSVDVAGTYQLHVYVKDSKNKTVESIKSIIF